MSTHVINFVNQIFLPPFRQLKEIFPDDTQIFSISQFITNWKPNTSISANSDELSLATAACKQAGK